MQNQSLARRYATAVFRLAKKAGAIDRVGADLTSVAATIYGSSDIRRFFLSPVFAHKQKEALLAEAFGSRVDDIVLHTTLLLVRKRREALLPSIVTEYEKLALEAARKEPLEIVSARELAPDELAGIVARLESSYGKAFEVKARTDESLLGGVRITMGDLRIDGSLAARLDQIARELFSRH